MSPCCRPSREPLPGWAPSSQPQGPQNPCPRGHKRTGQPEPGFKFLDLGYLDMLLSCGGVFEAATLSSGVQPARFCVGNNFQEVTDVFSLKSTGSSVSISPGHTHARTHARAHTLSACCTSGGSPSRLHTHMHACQLHARTHARTSAHTHVRARTHTLSTCCALGRALCLTSTARARAHTHTHSPTCFVL